MMFKCYRKGYGYVSKKQKPSIYVQYTEEADEAKSYKTKQGAARSHGFKSCDSDLAKAQLMFEEV